MILFHQVFAIVNTFLAGTLLAPEASNVLMLVLSITGTVLMPCAHERYARAAARKSEAEVEAGLVKSAANSINLSFPSSEFVG